MKVLSGIDKVFFSNVANVPAFDGNLGAITMITDNEGEFTREMKTIKLANGQDLTTCTEYKFKFETADFDSFGDIKSYADNGDKLAMVAYSETGGCLVWFINCQLFYKEIINQKSGELARLQVMVSTTGENELPINYGNNLIPLYIANGERVDELSTSNSTITTTTANGSFTLGSGNVIQIDPTGSVQGLAIFTFNYPCDNSMGTLRLSASAWKQNSEIELTIYDSDGVPLGVDTAIAPADNSSLSVDLTCSDYAYANYFDVKLRTPTNVTTQFDNIVLTYNQNLTGLVE